MSSLWRSAPHKLRLHRVGVSIQQPDMCYCRPEALDPFVELCFQGAVQRTHTAEGCAPLWNEHFVLPYQPTSGELGPSMMEEVRAQ